MTIRPSFMKKWVKNTFHGIQDIMPPVKHTAKGGEGFSKTAAKEGKQRDWLQMRKNQERLADFYLTRKIYWSKMRIASQNLE